MKRWFEKRNEYLLDNPFSKETMARGILLGLVTDEQAKALRDSGIFEPEQVVFGNLVLDEERKDEEWARNPKFYPGTCAIRMSSWVNRE